MENTVKTSTRIRAYLLDIFLIYVLLSLILSIKFLNPTYDKYIEAYDKYMEVVENYSSQKITLEEMNTQNTQNLYNVTKYSISSNIITIVVIFAYFGLFQKYNHGQTLGKKIMKIKVTNLDNEELGLKNYLLRIIPTYYIFIGNVISLLLMSLLVFVFKSNQYTIINTIIVYLFFGIGLASFIMIVKREDKRGLHDLLAKSKVVSESNNN